jgi:photosystem I subunit 10
MIVRHPRNIKDCNKIKTRGKFYGKKEKFTLKKSDCVHSIKKGVRSLIYSTLLAATANQVTTISWSPKVAVVMIICNIIAIAIGKFTIQQQNVGPSLPAPTMFGGMGLGALLGTTSLGHVIGAGVILGLANVGAL